LNLEFILTEIPVNHLAGILFAKKSGLSYFKDKPDPFISSVV